ncbi:hypothetical protein N802_15280 [Knoellia sinensis KCTC 19936]|uniref:Uncharacterized protein n=1 Tax=Knoellia sinensis KCTC 19936 TaxID=1385520 RepID=A0A0A0J9G6_9MICO|nr:hypothetical protein [Knoellia sinensis]KGN33414.1 hypothetical protein N802_15280 [Knoellia sinensis KCTC 19936]
MSTHMQASRRPRGSLIVLVCLALLWVAWAAWYFLAPDSNANGQCEGLGFGCTLTPRDLATFAGTIALGPMTGLVLLVTGAVRIVRVSAGSWRTIWDVIVWSLLSLAVAAVAAGTLAGAF